MDFIKVRNLCYDTIYDKTAQTAYIDQTEDLSPEHVKKSLIRRPIVMYGCESWTVKKAEHQGIDALQVWCWREKTLESPKGFVGKVQGSNQSILKEINPEYSLERLVLKPQYFGHLMQRADSLEKILILEKIEGKEEKGVTEDEMVGWLTQCT